MTQDDELLLTRSVNTIPRLKSLHAGVLQRLQEPHSIDPDLGMVSVKDGRILVECLKVALACEARMVGDSAGNVLAMEYAFRAPLHGKLHLVQAYYVRHNRVLSRDFDGTHDVASVVDEHLHYRLLTDLALALVRSPIFAPTGTEPIPLA